MEFRRVLFRSPRTGQDLPGSGYPLHPHRQEDGSAGAPDPDGRARREGCQPQRGIRSGRAGLLHRLCPAATGLSPLKRPRQQGARTAWVAAAAVLSGAPAAAAGTADAKALLSAADNRGEWLTHGRTYDQQRFSPLEQINTGNVKSLGLPRFADLDTAPRQEATPLGIDGTVHI